MGGLDQERCVRWRNWIVTPEDSENGSLGKQVGGVVDEGEWVAGKGEGEERDGLQIVPG